VLPEALVPEWDAHARVGAWMTTRAGGVSAPPYDSLNLGKGSGDALDAVLANRARLAAATGAHHVYLRQVHGNRAVHLTADVIDTPAEGADAAWTSEPGIACTVMAADCLPVLFAAPNARAVGAAHAGWRGLAAGVLERCARAVCEGASCEPSELAAWLGACIGPEAFEVGADVLAAFDREPLTSDQPRFRYRPRADGQSRWRADLAGLARDRLAALGVRHISGGTWCTVQDSRFFSHRRDAGLTGRMAACVWIR
jgi:YfiH family protein